MINARPYVVAAFEYALAQQEIPAWEAMLDAAALVVLDKRVQDLLNSTKASEAEMFEFFSGVLSKLLNPSRKNFIHLLSHHKRFNLLPEIAKLFKVYRAEQEKKIKVEVSSAVALSEDYKAKLIKALSIRLQKTVELECSLDPNLIGGVLVRAGDRVIDGSIRGKLARLEEFIE